MIHDLAQAVSSLAVTFGDRQLAQDYRAGRLQLIDGMRACLAVMVVIIVAALARQPRAVPLLIVMLGAIRHFGHRGEPHRPFLPASALKPLKECGAAYPVT
jgi:hypothetical protein